jgi:hypothetical protein
MARGAMAWCGHPSCPCWRGGPRASPLRAALTQIANSTCDGERVGSRDPRIARAWVGRTSVACFPSMGVPQSLGLPTHTRTAFSRKSRMGMPSSHVKSSRRPASHLHCAPKTNFRISGGVHACPCFSMLCMNYQCSFDIILHVQASGMVSRLDKRRTACRILIVVRTRLAEGEIGVRAVIALCKRYGGAALARADRPTVWHGLSSLRPCERALTRRRPAERPAPRCRPRRRAPSRVRPHQGPGARGGADGRVPPACG